MSRTKSSGLNYQSLYLWTSFLLGMISLGIVVWNRKSVVVQEIPVIQNEMRGHPLCTFVEIPLIAMDDSFVSTYQITFPTFTGSLLFSTLAYQLFENSAAVSLVSAVGIWNFAILASAQLVGLSTKVPQFPIGASPVMFNTDFGVAVQSSSGESLVVWAGDNAVLAQRVSAKGNMVGSELLVKIVDAYNANVVDLASGQWMVVWSDRYIIDARQIAANGNLGASEFQINTQTARIQNFPALANVPRNGWAIAWQTGSGGGIHDEDIYARRFALNGNALGNDFRVNQNITARQLYSDVASFLSGEWVVVWDSSFDLIYSDIYAQRFSTNGNFLGGQFRVNKNALGANQRPSVACLESGEWMVVWMRWASGRRNVYAQRFAADGSFLGDEFQVYSNSGKEQWHPVITSLSSSPSGWAVAWYESLGIFVQLIATNGSLIGGAFQVNNAGSDVKIKSLSAEELLVVWSTGNIYGTILSTTMPAVTTTRSTSTKPTTAKPTTVTTTNNVSQTPATALTQPITTASPIKNSATTYALVSTDTSQNIFTSSEVNSISSGDTFQSDDITTEVTDNKDQATVLIDSPTMRAVIGGVVGVCAFSLAVCLGAIGFYAYRKKSRTNQSIESNKNNIGLEDKNTAGTVSIRPDYNRVDEEKKTENQYDDRPKFTVYPQPNSESATHQKYRIVDEKKSPIREYDRPTVLRLDENMSDISSVTLQDDSKPKFV